MSLLARVIIFIVICLLALCVGISIRLDNDVIDCGEGFCPPPQEYRDNSMFLQKHYLIIIDCFR